MVKDLWALRLQLLKDKIDATPDEDLVFSSQPQSEVETEGEHERVGRKWKTRGKDTPSLIETLGLCYLGMILLRLPISIGEMHRYVARPLLKGSLAKSSLILAGLSEKTFLSSEL